MTSLSVEFEHVRDFVERNFSEITGSNCIVLYCTRLLTEGNPEQGKTKNNNSNNNNRTEQLPWRHSPTWHHEVK